MAAFNLIMLGVDSLLAHGLKPDHPVARMDPDYFRYCRWCSSCSLLVIIAVRNRVWASRLATIVFVLSVIVGVLGAYFHLAAWHPAFSIARTTSKYLFTSLGTTHFCPLGFCRDWFSGHCGCLGRNTTNKRDRFPTCVVSTKCLLVKPGLTCSLSA